MTLLAINTLNFIRTISSIYRGMVVVLLCCTFLGLQAQSASVDFEQGVALYEQKQYNKSAEIFNALISDAQLKKNPKALGKLYYRLGTFYASQGVEPMSLNLLLSSAELLEVDFATTRSNIIAPPLNESPATYNLSVPEDATLICAVYNKVGSLYFRQGNLGKARHYWRKSYQVAQKYKDAKALSTAYNNLGELQRLKGELDTAILYYQHVWRSNPMSKILLACTPIGQTLEMSIYKGCVLILHFTVTNKPIN